MALIGVPFDTAVSYRTGKLHQDIPSRRDATLKLLS